MKEFDEFKERAERFIQNPIKASSSKDVFIFNNCYCKNQPIVITYNKDNYKPWFSREKIYRIQIIIYSIMGTYDWIIYTFKTKYKMDEFQKLLDKWIKKNFR